MSVLPRDLEVVGERNVAICILCATRIYFCVFFFSSFLSVSNDHLGLTEQIISEFLSRLHFVLALSHERMEDEVDSGICCAGQWTNLSVSSLQLLLVVKGFTLHDSLPIKQKLKSEN